MLLSPDQGSGSVQEAWHEGGQDRVYYKQKGPPALRELTVRRPGYGAEVTSPRSMAVGSSEGARRVGFLFRAVLIPA